MVSDRDRAEISASCLRFHDLDFISASPCHRWAYMGYKSIGAMPPGTVENLPYVEGINYDAMQPWHVVDLHRYLFFQVAFTQLEVRVSVARSLTTAFSLPAGHLDHRRAPPPHLPRPGAHRCAGAGGAAAAAHAGREGLRDERRFSAT